MAYDELTQPYGVAASRVGAGDWIVTSQVLQYRFSELKLLLCQPRYTCLVALLTGRP